MEINSHHSINALFAQLGLDNDSASIYHFIQANKPLPPAILLADAPWWTPAQATFLREAIADNADWAIVIDQLNELLRAESDPAFTDGF